METDLLLRRRTALYGKYVKEGDLVFDVGANVGEVTKAFLALGCRVVAVEPQPRAATLISSAAEVVVAAVGAEEGMGRLFTVSGHSDLASLRPEMPELAEAVVADVRPFDLAVAVTVTTLDSLIDKHGVPAFVKLDVEGYEAEALKGLHTPVKALCFEAHSFDAAKTDACVAELERLGDYRLMYSPEETYGLSPFDSPVRFGRYGDVYATLEAS